MPNSRKLLAKNIADVMASKNISQTGLANLSKVSQPQISLYLKGKKTPSLEILDRLADALGVPTWRLLSEISPLSQGNSPQEKLRAAVQLLDGDEASLLLDLAQNLLLKRGEKSRKAQ
jgi:transcriptional regulator with XRE-family HTH domain